MTARAAGDFLREERAAFRRAGTEAPELSAEALLAAALGIERTELLRSLLLKPELPLDSLGPEALSLYAAYKARRLSGEPVAYILGQKEFYGRPFLVNPQVLIPRPETELLVEAALRECRGEDKAVFADLGTGSGCLAVTLALELGPGLRGLALDISAPALKTAEANALALGAAGQLTFIQGDYRRCVFAPASLRLVLANPPYISAADFARLEHGVRNFEPASALLAGEKGTEHLEAALQTAATALQPGGLLLLELGADQGAYLLGLARNDHAWTETEIIKDAAGRERMLRARRTARRESSQGALPPAPPQ